MLHYILPQNFHKNSHCFVAKFSQKFKLFWCEISTKMYSVLLKNLNKLFFTFFVGFNSDKLPGNLWRLFLNYLQTLETFHKFQKKIHKTAVKLSKYLGITSGELPYTFSLSVNDEKF